MASPSESAEQRRDAIPGRVRVVACVLRCQGIKFPYGGRGADDVRAGAFERDGPHRGGVEPSSEADLTRGGGGWALERGGPRPGGVDPSSEADPTRGVVKASSEAELARGSVATSHEADSTRGSV
jgi:hypothetical protein